MPTRLILLGTGGGPTPKRHRAATAQAVTVEGATYVIDCGNGVARQLAMAGVGFDSIRSVAITHHHSDTTPTSAPCCTSRGARTSAVPWTCTAHHRWRG
jgi:ribonuclease BN (tRNA processing enzyme)